MLTFPSNQDVKVKLNSELSFIKNFSHKQFHRCVNQKKKPSLRYPSPTLGRFSFSRHPFDLGSKRDFKN